MDNPEQQRLRQWKPQLPEPIERLIPRAGSDDEAPRSALSLLETGIIDYPRLDGLRVPFVVKEWDSISDRRTERLLYSLMAAEPLARGYQRLDDADKRKLEVELDRIFKELGALKRVDDKHMAFHDETTAQRLLITNEFISRVWKGEPPRSVEFVADRDRGLLMDDDFYAGRNNHGMFQNMALLADAANTDGPATEGLRAQVTKAAKRLEEYFSMAFTSEGVHIEHTPTYHVMVVKALAESIMLLRYLESSGYQVTSLDHLSRILQESATYATHMIGPDGLYPYYSDTTRRPLDRKDLYEIFCSSEFEYAATKGSRGERPSRNVVCFPKSGYAIYRSSWGDPNATFVLFTAAYNGGYHKHSDELSVIAYGNGRPLLIEAGPNGYNYDDPDTKYAFSSFAHNTLIVDGRGLPRVDKGQGKTRMLDSGCAATSLDATGTTDRFSGVRFERRVVCAEGDASPVQIRDSIHSKVSHEYRLLWHLGPGLIPEVRGDHVELVDDSTHKKIAELQFETTEPYQLRLTAPNDRTARINRWFPSMGKTEFAWTIETVFCSADVSLITTLQTVTFSLKQREESETNSAPVTCTSTTDPSVRFFIEDEQQEGPLTIVLSAINQPGDFTYNYRRTLQGLPGPKMFVMDDWGDQGAYYYSHSRDRSIFEAVQATISQQIEKLGGDRSSTRIVGSSKGGSAALIHGLALGVGRIVVGAPQIMIGSFVSDAHPNILKYMAGGTGAGDVVWVNQIIERAIANAAAKSRVTLLVGMEDHHYRRHAIPGEKLARQNGLDWETVAIPGVPHAEIGPVYSRFLKAFLESLDLDEYAHSVFSLPGRGIAAYVEIGRKQGKRVATRLYSGKTIVKKAEYQDSSVFEWRGLDRGSYRVRFFVRDSEENPPHAFTAPRILV